MAGAVLQQGWVSVGGSRVAERLISAKFAGGRALKLRPADHCIGIVNRTLASLFFHTRT
jgi:hypothetical protein